MVIAALAIGVGLLVTPFALVWLTLRRQGSRSHDDAPSMPPAAPPVPITPSVTVDSLASLPTEQLCRAWRLSYFLAIKAADPAVIDRIARTRRRYLDELE